MKRYENKVVLLTGAAGGFGQRAAERFALEGAKLCIADVKQDGLDETEKLVKKAGGEVVSRATDVSREDDCKALVDLAVSSFGKLDVAVNNAGVAHTMARLPDIPFDEYSRVMNINAGGVFLGMKYQLPALMQNGGGAILNIASVAGLIGAAMMSAYAASKHAVVGLTRAAAEEYAKKGIRVNCICPAFAMTPMLGDAVRKSGDAGQEARDSLTIRLPMKRIGSVDEIVQGMLWVCSDENSFMTGAAIPIDGGLTAI